MFQSRKLYEFNVVRRNALANPNLYDGRYTQKNRKDALIEFLFDNYEYEVRRHNATLDKMAREQGNQ